MLKISLPEYLCPFFLNIWSEICSIKNKHFFKSICSISQLSISSLSLTSFSLISSSFMFGWRADGAQGGGGDSQSFGALCTVTDSSHSCWYLSPRTKPYMLPVCVWEWLQRPSDEQSSGLRNLNT